MLWIALYRNQPSTPLTIGMCQIQKFHRVFEIHASRMKTPNRFHWKIQLSWRWILCFKRRIPCCISSSLCQLVVGSNSVLQFLFSNYLFPCRLLNIPGNCIAIIFAALSFRQKQMTAMILNICSLILLFIMLLVFSFRNGPINYSFGKSSRDTENHSSCNT